MNAQRQIADRLRDHAKVWGQSDIIKLARRNGAKLHCHEDLDALLVPACPWVVLDQEAIPHLYYGFFPSEYSAAFVYCVFNMLIPDGLR
jgi:hypothetical protein